jgi:hypothetical protein
VLATPVVNPLLDRRGSAGEVERAVLPDDGIARLPCVDARVHPLRGDIGAIAGAAAPVSSASAMASATVAPLRDFAMCVSVRARAFLRLSFSALRR